MVNGNKHARSIAVVQFSSASAFLRPPREAMGTTGARKGCVLAIQGRFLASQWLVVFDGSDLKCIGGEGQPEASPGRWFASWARARSPSFVSPMF